MMRFPALLLLMLACTDKPIVERPRLDSLPPDSAQFDSLLDATRPDTADSGWLPDSLRPDTTALDSLLDSLPQPPVSVDTLVTPPRVDTIPPSIDTTPAIIVTLPPETTVVVVVPAPLGLPWGPAGLWTSSTPPAVAPFTLSMNADGPDGIVARVAAARKLKHRLILTMTGGKHDRYLTDSAFDLTKWTARQRLYDTPAIKAAIAQGLADGTILGANILDEPQHVSWGGVITKPLLDSMARTVKALFPGIPVGLSVKLDWKADQTYKAIDFVVTQYVASYGSVTAWRDKTLAGARKNGVALVFSLNILNGGAGFGVVTCPDSTGGTGYSAGRCAMSPVQLRNGALALAPFGCALNLWQHDAGYMAKPANRAVLVDLGLTLAQLPTTPCLRRS